MIFMFFSGTKYLFTVNLFLSFHYINSNGFTNLLMRIY